MPKSRSTFTREEHAEVTRLLHLAMIAQIQAWEAQMNLETFLLGVLPCGSPEFRATELHIADAVMELACEGKIRRVAKPPLKILASADANVLLDILREYATSRNAKARHKEAP